MGWVAGIERQGERVGRQLLVALLLLGTVALSGCLPFGSTQALEGQVVDAETGVPVGGAVVTRDRRATCWKVVQGDTYRLPPLEAVTGPDGRFRVGGGLWRAPCLADGALDSLDLEFDWHRQLAQGHPSGDAGPASRKVAAVTRALSVRDTGPPGVLAMQPGAAFERIAVVAHPPGPAPEDFRDRHLRQIVAGLAWDRRTGSTASWTLAGRPAGLEVPTGPDAALVGAPWLRGYHLPLVASRDRILFPREPFLPSRPSVGDWYGRATGLGEVQAAAEGHYGILAVGGPERSLAVYPYSVDGRVLTRTVTGERRLPLSQTLPGARAPVECLTRLAEPIVGTGVDPVVAVAHTESGRALYLLDPTSPPGRTWVQRVDLPGDARSDEVSACAGGRHAVYLAVRDRGILRVDLAQQWVQRDGGSLDWKPTAVLKGRFPTPDLGMPLTFHGLAVGKADLLEEVVYAVAGTEHVYRFAADGRPDRRIELDPRGATGVR